MKPKNILICVSGLTPQIVTETFFCLAVKEKTPIDEIYILTTKRGRDVILGIDKAPHTPKSPLKKELKKLCDKYKLKMPSFENDDTHIITAKEESIELSDVRTDKHNILFPNKTCEFIKNISSRNNTTLFCSISGGRKTMSVHLAFALTLFGRENDKLLHVLTSEENEFKGFYPQNKNEAKQLELSEIPFVRLRPLISPEIKDQNLLKHKFDEIVSITQTQLKILSDKTKLIVDIERRELRYGNEIVSLEPMEFLFYYFFIDLNNRGIKNISVEQFTADETKIKFAEYFEEYYPNIYIKEKRWFKKGFSKEDFRTKRSKVNSKISELIEDNDAASVFIINSARKWGDSKYFIQADKNRFVVKL